MASIVHPSLKQKSVPVQKVVAENYVVENAEAEKMTAEKEPETLIQQQNEQQKDVDEKVKKKLEDLLFVGRVTKDVVIAGNTFSLSTLTNKEHNEIAREIYKSGDNLDMIAVRSFYLAYSLKKINGICLSDIDIGGEFETELKKNVEVVNNLQLTVVERLFDEYGKIFDESKQLIAGEDLKN